jgi:Guanylate-binding protein, N-terminal domain
MRLLQTFCVLCSFGCLSVSLASPFASSDTIDAHPFGQAINILRFSEDGSMITNSEAVDEILLHPDVGNRKIVVVSIVGAYRKGKSFLMDYFLRFMYGNVSWRMIIIAIDI